MESEIYPKLFKITNYSDVFFHKNVYINNIKSVWNFYKKYNKFIDINIDYKQKYDFKILNDYSSLQNLIICGPKSTGKKTFVKFL